MPIFLRVNKRLGFAYTKCESDILIEIKISGKWIFYPNQENTPVEVIEFTLIVSPRNCAKKMNWLIPRGFKSSKICVGFRHKIVYLFRSSCGTRKEGLFFMTEVIKKLKLGIIKHYTKGNLAQVPIQFTRPEVLIWRDINEEILIFFPERCGIPECQNVLPSLDYQATDILLNVQDLFSISSFFVYEFIIH